MALITESQLRTMLKEGIPSPYPINKGDRLTPAATDFLKERGIKLDLLSTMSMASSHLPGDASGKLTVPVGVSNRHIHLSPEDMERLFGTGYVLTPFRDLSQPGQFAAKEKVTLLGPDGLIKDVRILGPTRKATQVEISKTDGFHLGIHPPIRLSGLIEATPGVTLIGPKGCAVLNEGVIVAKSHVHMGPDDAKHFKVTNGDSLMVKTAGDRSVIFANVSVRVSPAYILDLHIDRDEANAANLITGDKVSVIGKNGKLLSWNGR
ncbi:putative phosphotransacetylase [Scopulibacillus darangshiensis]|uniref:Phosphate propanoyltransferase n=1 Tax=Scopulibacillus darangshiensis TaxID=442528 RepID=A0A4R2PC92_9BACL|nr:phosphate propanoyltransferase [Scopulibacillus darangshiensis]TCP31545.1 putative phosphotransacetylase [Scopulibacillus darangshiensis]